MTFKTRFLIVFLGIMLGACKLISKDTIQPTILSASIRELAPLNLRVEGRKIRFSIEINELPLCNKQNEHWQFGFLIDADKDAATGLKDTAYADLGVDAGIVVTCDAVTGSYVSNVGQVTTYKDIGSTTLHIETVAEALASINFYYLAFAHDTNTFTRLPESPYFSGWAINEIRRY